LLKEIKFTGKKSNLPGSHLKIFTDNTISLPTIPELPEPQAKKQKPLHPLSKGKIEWPGP
jgi:hypothetical protein